MSDVIINNPDFFDQLSDDVILALYLYKGGTDYNTTNGEKCRYIIRRGGVVVSIFGIIR